MVAHILDGMSPKGRARAAAARSDPNNRTIAVNRRARHDYDVLDTYECGIALVGGEVKTLREGKVTLRDSFARVEGGEMWLHGMHIPPYAQAQGFGSHDPDRARKLLLHRREIGELGARVAQQSLTLVPLSLYFKQGRAKIELGLARGRRQYDKRAAIAARDAGRDTERELRRAGRETDRLR